MTQKKFTQIAFNMSDVSPDDLHIDLRPGAAIDVETLLNALRVGLSSGGLQLQACTREFNHASDSTCIVYAAGPHTMTAAKIGH